MFKVKNNQLFEVGMFTRMLVFRPNNLHPAYNFTHQRKPINCDPK